MLIIVYNKLYKYYYLVLYKLQIIILEINYRYFITYDSTHDDLQDIGVSTIFFIMINRILILQK